jgi:alpha-L-glutamate ligase-like protein
MKWLFASGQLRRRGVLGINRRNAECLLDRNPRSRVGVVDNKLLMAQLCGRIGVPTPAIFGVLSRQGDASALADVLDGRDEFVMKPACGFGGRGVLIVAARDEEFFVDASGRTLSLDDLQAHASDVLSGLCSLGGKPDCLLLQQRVRPHPAFAPMAPCGTADVRIVLYRFEPAMAMLRLPTLGSKGRANLHQGGVGVGVNLATGVTDHAIYQGRSVDSHPDTGAPLLSRRIPAWEESLAMARKAARATGLGFVGIDIILDARYGPLLLEANARPGLTIQMANGRGLAAAIEAIDRGFD